MMGKKKGFDNSFTQNRIPKINKRPKKAYFSKTYANKTMKDERLKKEMGYECLNRIQTLP